MRYGPFPMARREWTLNQLAPLASGKDREDEVPLNICYFSGSNSKIARSLWNFDGKMVEPELVAMQGAQILCFHRFLVRNLWIQTD